MARETGTIVVCESLFDYGKIQRDVNKEEFEFSMYDIEFAENDDRSYSEIEIGQRVSFEIQDGRAVVVRLE